MTKRKQAKSKAPLTPPDRTRCQAEHLAGAFSFGPPSWVRCKNVPIVIATERKSGPDGRRGSMSLCAACFNVFKRKRGDDHATFEAIENDRT